MKRKTLVFLVGFPCCFFCIKKTRVGGSGHPKKWPPAISLASFGSGPASHSVAGQPSRNNVSNVVSPVERPPNPDLPNRASGTFYGPWRRNP